MINFKGLLWLVNIFIFLIGIYVFRYQTTKIIPPKTAENVVLKGILTSEPKISGQSAYFDFQGIRVRTRAYPELTFGDSLIISGRLLPTMQMNFPQIEKREVNQGFFLLGALSKVRDVFMVKINQFLPEPQASLLAGILLGVDRMPEDFKKDLRTTGIIHVVVVSGQNVALIAGFFLSLSGLIRRRQALILAFLGVILYSLLVGARPPTIRAALMGMAAFLAQFFGRQVWGLWTLLLVAALMLLVSPEFLFDLSFQLSFMATLGILTLTPFFLRWFRFFPGVLRENLAVTLGAQVLTMPILVFNFGQLSLISPLTNLLIAPLVPQIMVLGFIIILGGVWVSFIGQMVSWIAFVPLTIFVWITTVLANIPLAVISQIYLDIVWIIGYYIVILFLILWIGKDGGLKTISR